MLLGAMRWQKSASCLALLMALSSVALAQNPTRDPAAAEALFTEGRTAFDAGRYTEACQKFAESQRLDPAPGTIINLAACREKTGELALAWTAWREALRTLRPDDERQPEVARRVKAIEGRVPRLTIDGQLPQDARLFRDGVELGLASIGTTVPVNPGKHTVLVEAPGRETAKFEIELKESESQKIAVDIGPPKQEPPPEVKPKVETAPPPQPTSDKTASSMDQRTLGFVVGGVGVASLLASGMTGYLALNRKHTMQDNCTEQAGAQHCNPDGLDAADSGKTMATVSTITFAAGVALVGVGAYFVLTSDRHGATTVGGSVAPNGGGFRLVRSF